MICPYGQDIQCHLQCHIHTDCSSTNFPQNKYLYKQATKLQVYYVKNLISFKEQQRTYLTSIMMQAKEKQLTPGIHRCSQFGTGTLSILQRYVDTHCESSQTHFFA